MAGIGQPFSPGDQSVPWNSSQVPFSMGRTIPNDTANALNKSSLNNFQQGPEKRPMYSEENGDAAHNAYRSSYCTSQAEKDLFPSPMSFAFPSRNGESSNSAALDALSRSNSRIPAPPHHLNLDGAATSSQQQQAAAAQAAMQAFSNLTPRSGGFPPSSAVYPPPPSSVTKVSGGRAGLFTAGGPLSAAPSSGSGSTTPVTLDSSEYPPLNVRGLVGGPSLASHMNLSGSMGGVIGSGLGGGGGGGSSGSSGGVGSGGSISNQILSGGPPGSVSAAAVRNYVNVMSKGQTSEQNEFTIQQEDFPALPGAQNPSSSTATSSSAAATVSSTNSVTLSVGATSTASSMSHSQVSYLSQLQQAAAAVGHLSQQQQLPQQQQAPNSPQLPPNLQQQQQVPQSTSGSQAAFQSISTSVPQQQMGPPRIILHPNSSQVSNIPKSMIHDPFGMVGLLKLMKVGETEPTLNLLAPGIDLTGLGVNVGQPADIHPNFVSPWQESCIGRPQDLDYPVPPEYRIRHQISDILPDPSMNKLTDETLFWLFYHCSKEESQLAAAKELYNRDWRFHRKEHLWLTRANNGEPPQQVNGMYCGIYSVWDPMMLKKVSRQLTLNYTDLDTSPRDSKVMSLTYGLPLHHPKPPPVVLQQQQQNPVSVATQLAQQQQPASSQHH